MLTFSRKQDVELKTVPDAGEALILADPANDVPKGGDLPAPDTNKSVCVTRRRNFLTGR